MSIYPTPKKRNAQVALEFMLFAVIAFIILTAMLFSMRKQLIDLNSQRDTKELNDVVNRLREEIFLASIVQDGYYREFSLPNTINRKNYQLSISDKLVVGTIRNYTLTIPVPDVAGSPQKGSNTINRTGGVIYLN